MTVANWENDWDRIERADRHCYHCDRPTTWDDREDSLEAKMPYAHCGDCIDLAVWGATCDYCGNIPLRNRCKP